MTAPMLCLVGPTAIGKTALGEQLAEILNAEIISVDSALIYRGMDIGTAKPTKEEQQKTPYHLIDILDPSERYSVGDFYRDAVKIHTDILQRQRPAILIGGTMMYFQALWNGLADLPEPSKEIRQRLENEKKQLGLDALYQRLQKVDPISSQKIKSTDPQRIQRALEVYEITGEPLSQLILQTALPPVSKHALVIVPEKRETLHQRIADRFHAMLANGFLDEVEALYRRGDLNPDLPSIRAVGYRQAWMYLDGLISYDDMITQAIAATRQLAKRQLTWIRGWTDVTVMLDTEISLEKAKAFFIGS